MPKQKIVNVACVPQRSPFRYPGGKTWLVPAFRQWMRCLASRPAILVEPFAGGGIIGLTAAFEKLADKVLLVEIDEGVAAVWKTVLGSNAGWLAKEIMEFPISVESVKVELSKPSRSVRHRAFQTILKNRSYHGGIMANGSSLMKLGENGKGIRSRWYPQTLKNRILDISAVRDRIQFLEGDGMQALRSHAARSDAVFFIDPPYTAPGKKAGSRLYKYNELDHAELFCIASTLAGDFLMTYDNAPSVLEMAKRHGFDTEVIPMKNTHNAEMTELLVGRNLNWVRATVVRTETERLLFDDA